MIVKNNIKLKFGMDDRELSIVQHYEGNNLIVNELAVIDSIGVCDPVIFDCDVVSFLAAISKAINAPKRERVK